MRSGGKIFAPLILMMAAIILSDAPASAASAPALAEPSLSASAREAVDAAVSGLNLQTEIPDPPPGSRPPRDDRRRDRGDYSPDYGEPVRVSGQLPALMARLLLWISVAVIVVIVVMAVRDNLRNLGRSRQLEREEAPEINPGDAQAVARMSLSQDEADELARRGLFAEAMHVLLLRSVSEMRRRLDISIAASLTSREILHRVSLPPEGRNGLADIIGRVEISYFGPYQPGAEEYLACRRSFELLTGNLRREVAR